jgi:hypothetical protein
MAGVNAQIDLTINAQQVGTNDLGSPQMTLSPIKEVLQFVSGTDAVNELDILFADTRTLAASANENLDVAGALTGALGATITAGEIVAIFVKAAQGNANNVNVSQPASNGLPGLFLAAGDGVSIKPGEWQLFASQKGWPVTAGTGDLINVANSGAGTSVSYDVVILGRTAAA